eukprot:scaffold16033_cov55-Cyclotella_meneghiniana.AAC.1
MASELWRRVRVRPIFQLRRSCDAGQNIDEDGGAAALLVFRMIALGPDGVAEAGVWSIFLLLFDISVFACCVGVR